MTCFAPRIFCLPLCLALSAVAIAQDNNEDQSAKAIRDRRVRALVEQIDKQVQAEKAAKVAADAGIRVEVVAGPLNPAEQQYFDRLKPLLSVELALAVRVCNLDGAQRKELIASGEECAKKAARELASPQQQQVQGFGGGFGRPGFGGGRPVIGGQAGRRTARQLLDDSLAEVIKAKFPAETSALYAKELAKRADARKEMIVENIVALLDKKLVLTAQQREQIGKALLAGLDENWVPQLQILMSDNDYIPIFPENDLLPHLRESQKAVWQGLPNRAVQFGFDPFDNSPFGNTGIPAVEIEMLKK